MRGQRDYWDRQAASANFAVPIEVELLAQYLARDAAILDVGCGYGRALSELASAGFSHLSGVDPSPGMIARARRMVPGAHLAVLEHQRIPLPNAACDAVLLVAVLTCNPEDSAQIACIEEIVRVLRPGGIAFVSDFLLTDDARNRERYASTRPEGAPYGVFRLPDAVVHRHHDPDWISRLLRPFTTLLYREAAVRSRYDHPVNGFQFIGRRPSEKP